MRSPYLRSAPVVAALLLAMVPIVAWGEVSLQSMPTISLNSPRSIAVADYDEDGHLDLAVASTYGNAVSILKGDGSGQFATPSILSAGQTPQQVITQSETRVVMLDLKTAKLRIGYVDGAGDTLYAGEHFQLQFIFCEQYPFSAPEVM